MKAEQENCTVTVRGVQVVEGEEDTVELVTGGRFTSHGGRWLIRYEESDATGYGNLVLGVNGSRVHAQLRPEGGQLEFHYSLDVNTALISENAVYVTVLPR